MTVDVEKLPNRICMLVLDFDGVLTDGHVLIGPEGHLYKEVAYQDIVGITRWRRLGRKVCIISGEDSPMLQWYARTYKIHSLRAGIKDKLHHLMELTEEHSIELSRICYMGDDIMDLGPMSASGLSATVPNGHPAVRSTAHWVSSREGGNGAVRELIDWILSAQGIPLEHEGK